MVNDVVNFIVIKLEQLIEAEECALLVVVAKHLLEYNCFKKIEFIVTEYYFKFIVIIIYWHFGLSNF